VERTAVRGRLSWLAAEVVELVDENPTVRGIVLSCPGWSGHLPGQHVDVRLTAEDGYQAQRSYSIAAPENGEQVTITVELIGDGEVSPYLVGELGVGDVIELRGPIGGYFVWTAEMGGPLQLLAGGSGIVPLMAMIRSQVGATPAIPTRLLVSARSYDSMIYRDELAVLTEKMESLAVTYTLTRSQPPGWTGQDRRVDQAMLAEATWSSDERPLVYVCGPTGFVETVASILVGQGHEGARIKTERFGPSGTP